MTTSRTRMSGKQGAKAKPDKASARRALMATKVAATRAAMVVEVEPGQEMELRVGVLYRTPFPFWREPVKYEDWYIVDADVSRGWRWAIGCEKLPSISADPLDDDDHFADGVGARIVEIVGVVRPGRQFAPRVFYLRRWCNPDGLVFERKTLLCDTVGKVEAQIAGYHRPYTLRSAPRPRPTLRLVSGASSANSTAI